MNQELDYESRLCITENKLQQGTTKQEIQNTLGCHERIAREFIREVARVKPVIAVSSKKGYCMVPSRKGLTPEMDKYWETYCRHMIAENKSRAEKTLERNVPLEKWLAGEL